MYAIIVYDIGVERIDSVRILIKQYLNWIQNSVFEGEISTSNLAELKSGIGNLIDKSVDSVLVFTANNPKWLEKTSLGVDLNSIDNVI